MIEGIHMHTFPYVTLSHLTSKAQTVVHNWRTTTSNATYIHYRCTTLVASQIFTIFQQEFTVNNAGCNYYYCCNCIAFLDLQTVFLDFIWYFCNHNYCVTDIMLHLEKSPLQAKWDLSIVCHAEFGLALADKLDFGRH